MNTELLNSIIEIVFSGHLLYVAPFLLLIMSVTFLDSFIGLIFSAFETKRSRRY